MWSRESWGSHLAVAPSQSLSLFGLVEMTDLTIRTVDHAENGIAATGTSAPAPTSAAVSAGFWTTKSIVISTLLVGALVGGLAGGLAGPSATQPSSNPRTNDEVSELNVGGTTSAGGRTWKLLRDDQGYARISTSWDGETVFLVWDSSSKSEYGEIHVSYNYGATFSKIFGQESSDFRVAPGLSEIPWGRVRLAINPDATCVIVGSADTQFIFISTDSGKTFTPSNTGVAVESDSYVNTLAVAVSDDCQTILVSTASNSEPNKLTISRDGGQTFQPLATSPSLTGWQYINCDSTCSKIVAVSTGYEPTYSSMMYDKIAHISRDGGQTFSSTKIAKDEQYPRELCVDRESSVIVLPTMSYRYVSSDSGATFNRHAAEMEWSSCALPAEARTGTLMTIYTGNEKELAVSTNLGSSYTTFSIDTAAVKDIACDYNCDTIYVATESGLYISRAT
jgi:hypothetical protein